MCVKRHSGPTTTLYCLTGKCDRDCVSPAKPTDPRIAHRRERSEAAMPRKTSVVPVLLSSSIGVASGMTALQDEDAGSSATLKRHR